MNLKELAIKAEKSSTWLWILNLGLNHMIPFNGPHGLKIKSISANSIETFLPLKAKNCNHLKGIHACALATIGEFTGGALMISKLDPKKYRMILKQLDVNYFYQAKTDIYAKFDLNEDYFQTNILKKIEELDAIDEEMLVDIFDTNQNKICTVRTVWQIKNWNKVKTKV